MSNRALVLYGGGVASQSTDEETPLPESFGAVVGENVRRLRTQRGLSQSEFAGLLSAFGPTWAKGKVIALETGKRGSVTIDELCQLSGCLRAKPSDLFQGDGAVPIDADVFVALDRLRWALEQNEHVPLQIEPLARHADVVQAQVDEDLLAFDLALRLDQPLNAVRTAASRLFGRDLTAERDARVSAVDDPGTVAYRRREVSKQLAREIKQALAARDAK